MKQNLKKELQEIKNKVSELEKKLEGEEVEYYRCLSYEYPYFTVGLIYKMSKNCLIGDIGGGLFLSDNELERDFEPIKKPEEIEEYWWMGSGGDVCDDNWDNGRIDNFRWKQGNVFNDQKSCQAMIDIINKRDI